jgi:hypothetical protein
MLLHIIRRCRLYDDNPDENGLYNGLIVPKHHANLILKLAYLSIFSSPFAIYQGYYLHSLIPLSVSLTTLLYWEKPTYGLRRYIDIGVVSSGYLYNFYNICGSEYIVWFYVIKIISILCYVIGWYYHSKGLISYGTFFHCGIHVFGHMGCIILYLR